MSAFWNHFFLRFERVGMEETIASSSSSFVIYKEKRKRKASAFFYSFLKNHFVLSLFFSSQSLNILGQLILRSQSIWRTLVVIGLAGTTTLNLALALHLTLTLSQQNLTGSHVVLHWVGHGMARHARAHGHGTPRPR